MSSRSIRYTILLVAVTSVLARQAVARADEQATATPVKTAPGGEAPATTQPENDVQKAIKKYIKEKGGAEPIGDLEAVNNDDLKTLFPDYSFAFLTIPRWPVAPFPPKPLEMNNIFAVDGKGAVTQFTKADDLQKFFAGNLRPVRGDDRLKAASAWATLTIELFQDGMFKFTVGKPIQRPSSRAISIQVSTTVAPAAGDTGELVSNLLFTPAGKFISATDTSTLKAGARPESTSTKP